MAADIELLRLVHHHRLMALDAALYWFSFATTYISLTIIGSVVVQAVRDKSMALRRKSWVLLMVLMLSGVISFVFKHLVQRERPFAVYADIQKLSEAGSASFPSGHTLESFAMVCAVLLLFPERTVLRVMVCWACLVGYSRMALGVHYPSDVLGGACIGVVLAFVVVNTAKPWYRGT
jgi:undecaprenyl-diphosphatase